MDPCTSLHMQQLAIEGKSQTEIAAILSVDPSTVSRNLSDESIKAKIAYCRNELVAKAYSKSVDNVVKVIEDYQTPAANKDELVRREHGFKASLRVMESMGLIESRTQPAFVQNILVQNNNQYISPLTEKALSQALTVVDAEIIDNESY